MGKVVEHLVGEDGLAVHLPFVDRHAGDLRDGPQRELRVAVLTDDGGVHVTLCHIGPLTDEPAQPRGVEHGSGREHSAGRQSRDVLGDDGEDIARVGDQDEQRIGRLFEQLGHEGLEDSGVDTGEIEPGLTGLLLGASSDEDNVGVDGVLDVGTTHDRCRGELGAVSQVGDLSLHLVLVDVVETDDVGRTANETGIGQRAADTSSTDNRDLATIDCFQGHVSILFEKIVRTR